ncbi:hypothetical protein [Mycobacterium decipiens]|uniref:Uncharacterized protein n=1 Tax=Mycobacterium decipiens TaxID=1430326 RepID=A0A1X2LQ37_9MYCO|nr:hypothetical protein [Mycobacterium decipiens]OSC38473.1 hypothetical protein B8W66_20380 [Mycobacterium decipiens]
MIEAEYYGAIDPWYGQFWLIGLGDLAFEGDLKKWVWAGRKPGDALGLVGTTPGAVAFLCSSDLHRVGLRLCTHLSPVPADREQWESIGEVSVTFDTPPRLTNPEDFEPDETLRCLRIPAGTYRVRAAARGGDAIRKHQNQENHDMNCPPLDIRDRTAPSDLIEQLRIDLWPTTGIEEPSTLKPPPAVQ